MKNFNPPDWKIHLWIILGLSIPIITALVAAWYGIRH